MRVESNKEIHSINEIRQSLHKLLVSPRFTEQDAVELYCFAKNKYGYINENKEVIIQPRADGR